MNGISVESSPNLTLAGTWQLALDAGDTGLTGRWFARPLANARPVQLPGSLAVQRIGDDVTKDTAWTGTIFDRAFYDAAEYAPYREPGRIRIPFFLQPDKVFTGPAWYQREIEIPAAWSSRRIMLALERPHWATTAWLDETELGSGDSLAAGVATALVRGEQMPDAVKLGIACGAANAMTKTAGVVDPKAVEQLLARVVVEAI